MTGFVRVRSDWVEGLTVFVFTAALSVTGVDQILNFNAAEDQIWLDDAVYTGISTGALNASAFAVGLAAPTRSTG